METAWMSEKFILLTFLVYKFNINGTKPNIFQNDLPDKTVEDKGPSRKKN